jgi:hypothetical protein
MLKIRMGCPGCHIAQGIMNIASPRNHAGIPQKFVGDGLVKNDRACHG